MLQLWLRCWLTSGLMLCGWTGMFWVGIFGIMFRSSLGGLLCRLQLLWGEFSFLLIASLYWFFCGFGFSVFLLFIGCYGFFVDSLVLEFFLITAISILWWWFSVLKFPLLLFILLNDVRCCAFIGLIYVVRGFSIGCALVSSKFLWGWWLGSGWMVSFSISDYFRI